MERAKRLTTVVAILAAAFVLFEGATAEAAGKDFGLGIILGDPTGITGKYWLNGQNAVDFHMAFDFDDDDRWDVFSLYADYLWHFDVFNLRSSSVSLPLYVGVGPELHFVDYNDNYRPGENHRDRDDNIWLGVRIPIGIAVLLSKAPLEFFFEIAPGMRVFPSTDADFDAAIGARFYF